MEFIRPVAAFLSWRLRFLGFLVIGLAVVLAGWVGQESRMPPRPPAVQAPDPVAPPLATGLQTDQPVILLADTDYLPRTLALLAGAQREIDITMFSCVLPEDARPEHPVRRLLETLVARAQAGVAVRVVLDHGVPASRRQVDEEVPSATAAKWLAVRSIAVRWDEDERTTHTKSLVVDGRWCIVGSTNWTFSALRRNREQSLLLDNPVLAATLTMRFTALWKRATPVSTPAQR